MSIKGKYKPHQTKKYGALYRLGAAFFLSISGASAEEAKPDTAKGKPPSSAEYNIDPNVYKQAAKYSANSDGVGVIVLVGRKDIEVLAASKMTSDFFRELISSKMKQNGYESQYFFSFPSKLDYSLITYYVDGHPYVDKRTGKSMFSPDYAGIIVPEVVGLSKALKKYPDPDRAGAPVRR